ncbi:ABC transporter ATP-binding protein [Peptococcus simiae]|uniref:ABC transporter ATP-binding protein n=1 Tax=Peptococcus simiae TaxID=1643805 RepID=UPI00398087FA
MPLVECRKLTKAYGKKTALADVSFSAEAGQVVGLFGPNASGKSTLMALLAGIINDYKGEILIAGQAPGKASKDLVAYQSDLVRLPDYYSLKDGLDLYDNFYPDFHRDRAEGFLRDFGLAEKDRIKRLSRGSQEKYFLSLTLARQAQVYLLDEPMNGLDPRARQDILDQLIRVYTPEALTIITTHMISDVETLVDSALYLKEGRIALYGDAEDLRRTHGTGLKDLFMEVSQ